MNMIIDEPTKTMEAANQLFFSGQIDKAITLTSELIKNNQLPELAYRLQAACYFQLQQFSNAEHSLQSLLKINNKSPDDHFNLAHVYEMQNKLTLSEQEYLSGLALNPDAIPSQIALANVYQKLEKKEAAIKLLNKIIEQNPKHNEAKYKLALIENDQDKIITALKNFIKEKPLEVEPKLNLCEFYLRSRDFKNALYYSTETMASGTHLFRTYFLAGLYSSFTHNWNNATISFGNALRLSPDNPIVHFEMAKNYLTAGNLEAGWQSYEWRRKLDQPSYIVSLLSTHSLWFGQSLKNKNVLLYTEPTKGPTLLFLRYLPDLIEKHSNITLLVTNDEFALVKNLNLPCTIISEIEKLPDNIDYVASLLSIPYIKKLTYESANLTKNKVALPKRADLDQYNTIGLSWHQIDNPFFNHPDSIDLDTLATLVNSINARIICLHPNKLNSSEINWCNKNKIEIPSITDNTDLISLIDKLDLIITVDSEIAHLAATQNKTTWVMLPYVTSWYFGAHKTKNSWYPTMQLFRQEKVNSWYSVISKILNSLINHVAFTDTKAISPEVLLTNKATALFADKQYLACIKHCQKAISQFPTHMSFWFYIGISAMAINKSELAISSFLTAGRLDPQNPNVCSNLGTIFYRLNKISKAVYYFERAIELSPNNSAFQRNLAITYFEIGLSEKGIATYRNAIATNESIENHFGYSMQLLGTGYYEEGWREYEYRLKLPNHNYYSLKINSPPWDGSQLTGKTLFLMNEQGLGDNIQFLRFIPLIKQKYDCKIIFACQRNLLRVAKQFSDLDQIICENEIIPPHDFHLCLLSLPLHFKIYNETLFLADKPYIIAHPILSDFWRQYFANCKKVKIGFCWSGSPQHINNLRRNCNLFDFIKLMQNPNIQLYSLQKNLTPEEKELLMAANIDDLGEMFDDLADTAAAITHLDLVLSIDSAIAHLSGAIGKKTWLLLPYYSEWRHPRNREYSPWYTTVKFYVQAEAGDWNSVFTKIEHDLLSLEHP